MESVSKRPLMVGNWKMNCNVGEGIKLVTALKNLLVDDQHIEIVVAPPFTDLFSVSVALADTDIKLGAQNLFWEDEGAYTGEVSGPFLKDVNCSFVIVGHSERRKYFAETDKIVNLKVQAALKNELIPIVCIGESLEEREGKKTLAVIERQLKNGLADIAIHDFDRLVIAYEPVWAIGTGKNATPDQAGEVHQFIRNWLTKQFDAPTANSIHLLYGGSAKPGNAFSLMREPHVDGLLVGGASLDADAFSDIVKYEEKMN